MPSNGQQLDEWLARLETYSPYEIDLGLDRVQTMLQRLSLAMPPTVIHVAGTNGKGSSVAMLEALLRTTTRRVACYTSPHLSKYNERIRVDGIDAADEEIVDAFAAVEAQRDGLPLTYFEFGTLAALVIFARRDVDIAILEIGMGGRLDAVNAVEPTASLITNIALDHCAWLGDSVEAIAAEKAGVMRPGKATVFAAADMPQTIADTARATGAVLLAATRDYHWSTQGAEWSWQFAGLSLGGLQRPSLVGEFQVQNAAGVLTLLAAAGFEDLLETTVIDAALASIVLPGRAQTIEDRFLLDVAHNPAAARALATAVGGTGPGRATVTILGMLDDKDVAGFVAALDPLTDHWIAVTPGSSRALTAGELARQVANATDRPCWIADSMSHAIERACEISAEQGKILITGSFYTVGAALVILAAAGNEHG
jgi:dihydrofolate synthase/folylpolyglutamate synthase